MTRLLTTTALSLALAAALIPDFPDGICFVPLAPLRDPDLLALTVAHALELSDEGDGMPAARLREFVLGGATRGILESMTVPVLMSH